MTCKVPSTIIKYEDHSEEVRLTNSSETILVAIPTRDRPEYLSILLSSLVFQTEQHFDVLIVDTSSNWNEDEGSLEYETLAPVSRFIQTLRAQGHAVTIKHVDVAGRSEVAAVNYAMVYATLNEYGYLYKTDDDHLLQPDLLARLLFAYESSPKPCLVSAMTPFMYRVKEGYSGPDSNPYYAWPEGKPITTIKLEDGEASIEIGHFDRCCSDLGIQPSQLASNANFFMKPECKLLWEDIGQCSLFADAAWMLKLEHYFGYKFFFDTGCVSWHVTAPSGGVREQNNNYEKNSEWDILRKRHLTHLMKEFSKE
jgi:glycosyltransferase involved in cell wall biosynthesis